MTDKIFTLGATILPNELTPDEFRHFAKLGLQIASSNYTYYYQHNPKHVYPSFAYPGYRIRSSWSRNSSYMSAYNFNVIYRYGGTVVKPATQRIIRSKPYESR